MRNILYMEPSLNGLSLILVKYFMVDYACYCRVHADAVRVYVHRFVCILPV